MTLHPSDLPIPTPNGFDTIIAKPAPALETALPQGLDVRIVGPALIYEGQLDMMRAVVVSSCLRTLIRQACQAGRLPPVRDAWFTLTTDLDLVERYGTQEDCAHCQAATDQALAELRAHPQDPLVVGVLAY